MSRRNTYDSMLKKFLWIDKYDFKYLNIKEKIHVSVIKISAVINNEHNQFDSLLSKKIITSCTCWLLLINLSYKYLDLTLFAILRTRMITWFRNLYGIINTILNILISRKNIYIRVIKLSDLINNEHNQFDSSLYKEIISLCTR